MQNTLSHPVAMFLPVFFKTQKNVQRTMQNTLLLAAYSYGSSKCCVSPLELCIICIILSSLYAILVATLIAFLHHRGELAISLYL